MTAALGAACSEAGARSGDAATGSATGSAVDPTNLAGGPSSTDRRASTSTVGSASGTGSGSGSGASAGNGATTTTSPVPAIPRSQWPRVAVVGDSLTQMSTDALELHLAASQWDAVVIDGELGAPIADRVLKLREVLAANPGLDAIVIALGTNDARLNFSSGRAMADSWAVTQASAFTALADARAARCIVWVGVNSNVKRWNLDFYGGVFNDWLRKYTTVADWAEVSKSHPEWFDIDDVHFTDLGKDAYARLITGSIEQTCRPGGALPTTTLGRLAPP